MAIASDNAGNLGGASGTITVAVTNPILLAFIHGPVGTTGVTASCTFNSVSMAQIATVDTPADRNIFCFYVAGVSGTNTLTASSAGGVGGISEVQWVSYTGANQTLPPTTVTNTAVSATSLSQNITIATGNDWVLLGGYDASGSAPTGGSGVTTTRRGTVSDNGITLDSNGPVSSGSQTGGFTWPSNSAASLILCDIQPAGGTTTSVPLRKLLGVGI